MRSPPLSQKPRALKVGPAAAHHRGWDFWPLIAGLAMALASCAVALFIVETEAVTAFPEILFACARNDLDGPACHAKALTAGWAMLATYGVSFAVLLALCWRLSRRAPPAFLHENAEAKTVLLSLFLSLPVIHLVLSAVSLASGSRIDDIQRFSIFISLENAFWPLWVLLYVYEREGVNKALLFVALSLTLLLTPYRAVGMAILLFGFLIPLAQRAVTAYLEKTFAHERKGLVRQAALLCLMALTVCLHLYSDSANRDIPNLAVGSLSNQRVKKILEAEGIVALSPTRPRLYQRLSYPLYQAGIVESLSQTQADILPTAGDELLRKMHLTDKLTLNEYIYQRIYLGEGVGQTTSLTYGEAKTYFSDFPFLWMLGVPLFLVGLWRGLLRWRIQTSSLLGLALWRSSQAGFVTIIPSLTLQLGVLGGLIAYDKVLQRYHRLRGVVAALAYRLAVLALLAVGLACAFSVVMTLTSPGSRVVTLTANEQCAIDKPTADRALENAIGGRFPYFFQMKTENYMSAAVPAGPHADERLKLIGDVLSPLVVCQEGHGRTITPLSDRLVGSHVNPMVFIVLLAVAYALSRFGFLQWMRLPARRVE